MAERLPPQVRECLEFLWDHRPALPIEEIPDHLQNALSWCLRKRKKLARIVGIGNKPYVEILAAGIGRLDEDRLWDVEKTVPPKDQAEDEPQQTVLDQLCDELSEQSAAIVRFLWNQKHRTSWDTLGDADQNKYPKMWRRRPPDENAIRTALKRTEERLAPVFDTYHVSLQIDFGKKRVRLQKRDSGD